MPLFFLILLLIVSPSFGADRRTELYANAYAMPGDPEVMRRLIESEGDLNALETWMIEETSRRNDVSGWWTLGQFYHQAGDLKLAAKNLGRALALDEKNEALLLARAKVWMRLRYIAFASEDLAALDKISPETIERKLLRVRPSREAWEVQEECLEIVGEMPKSASAEEIEAIYAKMNEVGLRDEAKEFLLKWGPDFGEDWRLQFLLASILEEEGGEAESGEIYRSLLQAEGEVAKRFHLDPRYGFWSPPSIPDELRPAGWPDSEARNSRIIFGFSIFRRGQIIPLPESAIEARMMSFGKLIRRGESPEMEGVDEPELLAAKYRDDGSFEKRTMEMIAENPGDLQARAILLNWGKFTSPPDKATAELLRSSIQAVAYDYPVFAIQMISGFVGSEMISREQGLEVLADLLGEDSAWEVIDAAADFSFAWNRWRMDGAEPLLSHPVVMEKILHWALSEHGKGEPDWLPGLGGYLLLEGRIDELVALINRYSGGSIKRGSRGRLRSEMDLDTMMRSYERAELAPGLLPERIIPSALRVKVPRLVDWLFEWVEQDTKNVGIRERLAKFYPNLEKKKISQGELKSHLKEIKDVGVRGLLASRVDGEELDEAMVELAKSSDLSDRVTLSWIEESRKNYEKAFDVLLEIERGNLTEREEVALDRRLVTLGALRVRLANDQWKIGEARSAWTRLFGKNGGEGSYQLKKLAPLLGLEDSIPAPPSRNEPQFAFLRGLERVKDLVLRKQVDEATAEAVLSFWRSDGPTSDRMAEYLKEQELMGTVLAKMKEESESGRQLLVLGTLARALGELELAEESFRKALESDAESFEAHLGLLILDEPDERDFGPMIEALPMVRIEEGVRLWREKESRSYQTNVREEIVILGLIEALLRRGEEVESNSRLATFVASWEIVDSSRYTRGVGQRLVEGFEGAAEIKMKLEKAIALMMLDKGKLAGTGFAKLAANQKKWALTEEELVSMAKRGFRSGLLAPKKPVVPSSFPLFNQYRFPQEKLWSADEYLREKGELGETLDEATMALVRERRPEMARSIELAKRLTVTDGVEAGKLLDEWKEELPRQKRLRREAVLKMVDDVLVFASKSTEVIDQLEGLWFEIMAGEPYLWSFEKALVGRWLHWRATLEGEEAGGFVERVLVSGLGPKEAWPLLGDLRGSGGLMPTEISHRVQQMNQLLPILFREEAVRKKAFSLIFQDGLLEIYGRDRFVWIYQRRDLVNDREESVKFYGELLRDFSKQTAGLSGDQVAQCGLFLMELVQARSLDQVMTKPPIQGLFRSDDWHPQLRSWVRILVAYEDREKLKFLDELVKERELVKEMVAMDQELLLKSLRRHFGSSYEEAELMMKELLADEVEDAELELAQLIEQWAKGEVQIDRNDHVGHTMWKSIYEYAKIDPEKAGEAAGGVMAAALKDNVQRDFHTLSSRYFTGIFEAGKNMEQWIALVVASYESVVSESLPVPQDLDGRLGYFLWGAIGSRYPELRHPLFLPEGVFRKIFLDAALKMNRAEQTVFLAGILPQVFKELLVEGGEGEKLLAWIEGDLREKSGLLADGLQAIVLQKLGREEERRKVFTNFLNQLVGADPILLGVVIGMASKEKAFFDDPEVWAWVEPLLKNYRNGLRAIPDRSGILRILAALARVEMEDHRAQVTELAEELSGNLLSPDGVSDLAGARENGSLKMIVGFLNAGENADLIGEVVRKYQEKLRGDLWTITSLLSEGRAELAGLLVQPEGERYHLDEGLKFEANAEEALGELTRNLSPQQSFQLEVVVAGLGGEGRLARLQKLMGRCAKECPEGYRAKWQVLATFAEEKALGADLREEFLEVAKEMTLPRAAQIDGSLRPSDSAKELLLVVHRAIANDLAAGNTAWAMKEVRALAAAEPEAYSDYLSVEARVVLEELLPHLLSGGKNELKALRLLLADSFHLRSTEDLPLVFWSAKLAHKRMNAEAEFDNAVSALSLTERQQSNLEWCLREQGREYGKERIEALSGWADAQRDLNKEIMGFFQEEGEAK